VGKGVAKKPLVLAQVYALVPGELEGGSKVVTGTTPILGFEASVLFDSGATHSFVSIVFVRLSKNFGTWSSCNYSRRENCGL
jgi:hypothetical protein